MAFNAQDKIAIEKAALIIRSTVHLHKAMSSIGWHLPSLKSGLINKKYLIGISTTLR